MTNNIICADKQMISKFISQIIFDWQDFSNQAGVFEIRCLGENRTTVSQIFTLDAIIEATDLAVRMNANKLNVYMTINPIYVNAVIISGKAAKDVDIVRAHYSFADANDELGIKGLNELSNLIKPDFIVITGTIPHERRHAYWRLNEPCLNLQLWKEKQKQIAVQFKTDKAVVNPSRIMRVAGTVSYPNKNKLAKGYVQELVIMHERSD